MQLNPEYLVIESFLEPTYQYTKLPQTKSHAEHTDFTMRDLPLGYIYVRNDSPPYVYQYITGAVALIFILPRPSKIGVGIIKVQEKKREK